MEEWTRERVGDLAALVADALPHEHLTDDELVACGWDDPGVVLATPGGEGVVSAVNRSTELGVHGVVRLLAVHPGARGQGMGRRLLAEAEAWCFDGGAAQISLGGGGPFYFWPGVDVRALAMLGLADAAGYQPTGAELNMSISTTFRSAPPEGVAVRRVLEDGEREALLAFVERWWPHWVAEVDRGVEQGAALAAVDESAATVVGFVCHSVNRAGWIGPIGTDPGWRGRGVGHALLGGACRDLMVANLGDAEIAWVGPVAFFARAGAAVSRVFRTYRKRP